MTITIKAPTTLYLGDNGRLTCGDMRCAGFTAHASGMRRDLSGQPMQKMGDAEIRWFVADLGQHPTCETCGAPAALIGDGARGWILA